MTVFWVYGVKINFHLILLNMATRIFKIIYVAHVIFLLDSAPLENAELQHRLRSLKYTVLLGHLCHTFSPERGYLSQKWGWMKMHPNILTCMHKTTHLATGNSKAVKE